MISSRRSVASTATILVVASSLVAGCGSSSTSSTPTTTPGATAPAATTPATTGAPSTSGGSGPVDVDYAGSLQTVMSSAVGPAFDATSGYSFTGMGADSGTLANEIKAKTLAADVYISASPAKDKLLEGAANGNLISWYATFATSTLVLGYDPSSKFASDLESEPWYSVVTRPGFLIGRTDPTTDPKGALALKVLDAAATEHGEPALAALATSSADVFPETTLVGRLMAGQLDAGFFYAVEAAAAKIPTVALSGAPAEHATYTVTVPADAPHPAAAAAFVTYLLGAAGAAELAKDGLTLSSPVTVSGTAPADLQGVLPGT